MLPTRAEPGTPSQCLCGQSDKQLNQRHSPQRLHLKRTTGEQSTRTWPLRPEPNLSEQVA